MIDEVEITIQGGRGGDGLISFLTEKYKPKGPPDGGSGGSGGSVYLIADTNTATLKDFSHKKLFKAENGVAGGPNGRTGACGNDLYIKVPVGTETAVADLDTPGQTILIAKGGKGGRGNAHMSKSQNFNTENLIQYTGRRFSKNKHIYYAERASDGEEKKLKLQLKLIADVGLIGLPNAGKSSLLNALTKTTKASVGAYPFTTLEPNLGVIPHTSTRTTTPGVENYSHTPGVILADIPGIIENAHEGKGLGDKFLKHIERTKVIVHVIEVPVQRTAALWAKKLNIKNTEEYRTIRKELRKWNPALLDKPEIVVLNKIDLILKTDPPLLSSIQSSALGRLISIIPTSTITGEGIDKLKKQIIKLVLAVSKAETAAKTKKETPPFKFTLDNLPNKKIVFLQNR